MKNIRYYLECLIRGEIASRKYTIDMCEEDIERYHNRRRRKPITVDKKDYLIQLICTTIGCDYGLVMSKCRKRECVMARQIFARLMYMDYNYLTMAQIGIYLGGRDHSTILNALAQFNDFYENEESTKKLYDDIKNEYDKYLNKSK